MASGIDDEYVSLDRNLWPAGEELPTAMVRRNWGRLRSIQQDMVGLPPAIRRVGVGSPRGLQGRLAAVIAAFVALIDLIAGLLVLPGRSELPGQPAGINEGWPPPELLAA